MSIAQITTIKPPRLMPGATIGIVSPASPFKKETLEQGVAILQAMGFRIRLAEGLFHAEGYLAGTDAQRAAQLHDMFRDDAVDAVICARGGFGSLRLLSLLDYDLIGSNPKPFIGFSDITALHQALFMKTGLVTFHGPMVCTLHHSDEPSRTGWQHALARDRPMRFQAEAGHLIRPGKAEGVLVGGNLSNLCHLIGTPFACTYRGCILFVEETGEALYRIDRMLTQMKLAGCFQGMTGLVLGSFEACGPQAEIRDLIDRLFADASMPIMAGLPAGHGDRNLTFPLGLPAAMDADAGELIISECATVA